ncbi:3-phosphoshikimate 1-carboxyvinyltransferase [Thermotoga sp. KOL6]|uniref:3-phosphoshikimate 1-carboxyvinyltransferase n=1 Tax=Thermotoga sp. KOL6 TaxID=126741 RepID=UPI000C78852D|nr:3-phosphoshikimate 1-carboxyvinyltransferase [Thermotoga sp. KOL6]PLV59087.1 3-phosphoshikimate 1-carboxyvinyltransferase [Thermotoga sp. KOL6]
MKIEPAKSVKGVLSVPPDKSITHRALILAALSETESTLYNLLRCLDTERTYDILRILGTEFAGDWKKMKVFPKPFVEPIEPLFCGNSGTTTRLMSGVLASYKMFTVLYGDDSLSKRPMGRVIEPLEIMGARFMARRNNYLPMAIKGNRLSGISYKTPVASAQVKSAILLAGLKADGKTIVIEPRKSRDHTERMLKNLGVPVHEEGTRVVLNPSSFRGFQIEIPGDISSASFFVVLGAIHPNARITVNDVGLNPTRIGLLEVMKLMGANVEWKITREDLEPIGRIEVETSPNLKGIIVPKELIPSMIDELPLVALLGAFAEGETIVRNAEELRKKESDRISVLVGNFRKIGVKIEEYNDGFKITGKQRIKGGKVDPKGDHRIAMLFSIAGVVSEEGIEVQNHGCVEVSFPNFYELLEKVIE